ncbi:hypothetical protein GCK32_008929 [Trichostrongylus colubriformis]|uniref:Receptor L-domain domain-containing protein n=1 Tax=Trichostrongylus colubriformis TaxID=6319 RepID=A0AAN8F879_TRICO
MKFMDVSIYMPYMTEGYNCETFVGHLWIENPNRTLPVFMRKLRVLIGCITLINSDLREFSLPSLHLLFYDQRICDPYALRFVNNSRLGRITFHRNFKWPKEHLILVTGQHRLTSERITPNGESFPLQSRVGDCRIDEKGEERCTMLYGTWDYNKISNQLHTLRTIEGRLVIDNTNLTDFSELENLTIIGLRPHALAVKRNPNLTDVSSLFKMNIKGPTPRVEWSLDGKEWCHSEADLQLLSRLTGETAVSLAFHVAFATSISGRVLDQGFLDELKERCKCFCVIQGDLVIKGLDASTIDLSPLRRIHAINGRLRIFNNTRLHSLSFLENLARIINPTDSPEPVIEIHGNKDLADVYLKNLHELRGSAGEIYTTWELDQRQQYKYKSFSTSAHFYVGDIPNYFIEREAKSKYPVSEVEFRNGSACFFSSRTKWRTLVSSSETCRHVYGDVEVDGVFFEYFRGKLTVGSSHFRIVLID